MLPLKLKQDSANDFLDMGKDLTNPEFGPRYVKYSANFLEHCLRLGFYVGEWSSVTNKPHGKGINISPTFINFGYFNVEHTGKYIEIYSNGTMHVGEGMTQADG